MSNSGPIESTFGELKPRNSDLLEIPLIGRTVVIGSSDSSDITLNQPGVHSKQCRLSKSGRSVMLEDLCGSTMLNGKFVEGRVEIRTGDLLTLGPLECEFTNLIPGAAPVTPSADIINDIDAFTFESAELPATESQPVPQAAQQTANEPPDVEQPDVWYAEATGRTFGPLSQDELVLLVKTGGLKPLDVVHHGDATQGKPCGTLPFLAELFVESQSHQPNEKTKKRRSATRPAKSARAEAPSKVRRGKRKKKPAVAPLDDSLPNTSAGGDTELMDEIMNDVLMADGPDTSSPPPVPQTILNPQTSVVDIPPNATPSVSPVPQLPPVPVTPPKTAKVPRAPRKTKSAGSGFSLPSFNFDPETFKKPFIVLGGLAVLYGVYWMFFSAPINRSAAIEQISSYYEAIKSARAANDTAKLEELGKRIKKETSEILPVLEQATDSGKTGHKADRAILFLIRGSLPQAVKAPVDDKIVIGIVESQIKEAKEAM